jgi:translocon-associated protein subunit gamma
MIDLYSSIISFIAVTLASTYLVALAYKNTKFVLKHKVSSDMKSFIIKWKGVKQ